jgi:nitrite reductase/ring-hydroxylating ferredoxin subunit
MKEIGRVRRSVLERERIVRLPHPPYDVVVVMTEGDVFALEDACNHAGASLAEGEVDGTTIACPMHGYLFDLRTGELLAPRGLCGAQRRYEVTREAAADGDVFVVRDPFVLRIL